MKRILLIILSLILLLNFGACKKDDASLLKFYVVDRNEINQGMSNKEIVSTVKKEGRLVFDGTDLDGYNWEKHKVTLNENSVGSIGATNSENGGSAIFKVDDSYAFALILDNSLIYFGGFEVGAKTPDIPLQPYIKDESKYVFSIKYDSKYSIEKDNRSNKKLYNFLENQGLLITNVN